MVANILPLDTHSTQGKKVKSYIFVEVVMLHIKLKGLSTEHHESKYAVITHTIDPGVGSKGYIFFFLKVVVLHTKLKWKK